MKGFYNILTNLLVVHVGMLTFTIKHCPEFYCYSCFWMDITKYLSDCKDLFLFYFIVLIIFLSFDQRMLHLTAV